MTVQYIENRIDDLEQNFNTLSHSLDNLWDRFCKFEKQLESQHHEDRILNLEDMARDDADKMDRLRDRFCKLYEEVTGKPAMMPIQVQQTTDEFVKVVRCRDCKHRFLEIIQGEKMFSCLYRMGTLDLNGYCDCGAKMDGERRKDG